MARGTRRLGVFDHHDGIGPARHRAAGGDGSRRPRQHRPHRRNAAGNHFVVQHHPHRRRFAGRRQIGGTHRKAVDIGTIERRHIDRRHHVLGERAAERIRKRPALAWHGARKQRGFEPRQRILARQDGQELVLIGIIRLFRQRRLAHAEIPITPATYRHRHRRPPQTPPSRRVPRARPRRGRSHRATIRRPPA